MMQRLAKRTLTFAISLSCALIIFVAIPFHGIPRPLPSSLLSYLVIMLFAAIAARGIISYSDRRKQKGIRRRNIDCLPDRSSTESLAAAAVKAFGSRVSRADTLQLIELFKNPSACVSRISERIELGDETYRIKLTQTIMGAHVDQTGAEVNNLLVPVLSPPKYELVDKLKLTYEDLPIRTLSYCETQGALLAIGETFMESVFGVVPKELWERIKLQILNEKKANEGERQAISNLLETELDKLNPQGDDVVLRDLLHNFVYSVQSTFPIIAIMPVRPVMKLQIEYIETRARLGERKQGDIRQISDGFYSHMRTAFGLARRSHTIPVPKATKARSYHFRADVPHGMYVYDIEIGFASLQDVGGTGVGAVARRPIDPRWDAADTRGLTYVHAYGRDLDIADTASRIPYLIVELREKPPGMIFVVTLLSVYLGSLTLGVGYWHDQIFGRSASPFWPAILFGIPAIVSGWLVSRFTSDAVSRLSISTLAVTSWFIANAVAAITLAALKLAGIVGSPALWGALMISATACAVMASLLLYLRVRRYHRRASGSMKKKRED